MIREKPRARERGRRKSMNQIIAELAVVAEENLNEGRKTTKTDEKQKKSIKLKFEREEEEEGRK